MIKVFYNFGQSKKTWNWNYSVHNFWKKIKAPLSKIWRKIFQALLIFLSISISQFLHLYIYNPPIFHTNYMSLMCKLYFKLSHKFLILSKFIIKLIKHLFNWFSYYLSYFSVHHIWNLKSKNNNYIKFIS